LLKSFCQSRETPADKDIRDAKKANGCPESWDKTKLFFKFYVESVTFKRFSHHLAEFIGKPQRFEHLYLV
jgi:hypothetical protein